MKLTALLSILIGSITISSISLAYSSGPLNGYAGNPPTNQNCTSCHTSYSVNSGTGSLQLLGLPDFYYPNTPYTLTIRIAQSGQQRWGFELTSQTRTNMRGGTITSTMADLTQLSIGPDSLPDYLKHTSDGTFAGTPNGPVEWEFQWTSPNSVDSIRFSLAGNAANYDFDNTGDYIYTRSYVIPGAIAPAPVTTYSLVPATLSGTATLSWVNPVGANLFHVRKLSNPYSTTSTPVFRATTAVSLVDSINFNTQQQEYYTITAVRGIRLSSRVQSIFSQYCISCHSGDSPSGSMDLSTGSSWNSLVNQASSSYELNRVTPFDTLNSVIWQKINGMTGFGSSMPMGSDLLSPRERADIARWITEGAVNY